MTYPTMRMFCDGQDSGYGNAARGYLQAFSAIGITPDILRAIPVICAASPLMKAGDPIARYSEGDWIGDDKINIVHVNPGMSNLYFTPVGGRYNILITAWETDRLTEKSYNKVVTLGDIETTRPQANVDGGYDQMDGVAAAVNWNNEEAASKRSDIGEVRTMTQDVNDYDEIWVPTHHVKEVMVRSGVTKPVFVIPHVLREEVLAMRPKAAFTTRDIGFYAIGPWDARKNTEGVVRAYFGTKWSIGHRVRLSLFSLPHVREQEDLEAHQWIVKEGVRQLKAVSAHPKFTPSVNLMSAPRAYPDHVQQAHGAHHVFVTASRGEGFCLPALDAVAMGNYVIGGGGPALEDLEKLAPGSVTLLPYNIVPITPMPQVGGYELSHKWWDISLDDLTSEMIAVESFIQTDGLPDSAEVEAVREAYSPTSIGKLIKARLDAAMEVVETSGW